MNNNKNVTWYKVLALLAISAVIAFVSNQISNYKMFITITLMVSLCLGIVLILKKKYLEKVFVMLFFLFIPFFAEVDFLKMYDFHINIKEYYTFNFIHILILPFLYLVLKNIKKIRIEGDLIILLIFNIICILGVVNSINTSASFFSYLRFIILSIIYIYISQILSFEKYSKYIYLSLTLGVVGQLIIGILQKALDGPIGLGILGESSIVFRVNVTGYEKGFSGTFGHPGDFALHALMVLSIVLFSKKIDKVVRNLCIFVSVTMIVFAAGRTSILIMLFIFASYYIIEILKFNMKKIIGLIYSLGGIVFLAMIFRNKLIPVINRFLQSDIQKQLESRLIHFDVGIEYIKQRPLFGLGLNNYLDHTYKDFPYTFNTHFSLSNPIHNVFILYAVELGLVGVTIFVIFLINSIIKAQVTKKFVDNINASLMNGCIVSIFVWSMYSLQGWASSKTRGLLMLFISCGIIANQYYKNKCKKDRKYYEPK